jgi:excisionase family DNA binding protein
MTTPPENTMTFGQVAARLGVEVTTIRRWVRTEQCPTLRDGRRVRIPAAWVDGLLEQGWR